jgi:NAD(P)-dependent dehydrogenase (short-subunit alcohol dehydrogenase family)
VEEIAMGEFSGLRAVVTGGVGGIGAAVSASLRTAGATVIATGYDQAEIDARQAEADLQGVDLAVLNVADPRAVESFAARFDRLDILVNCAGTTRRGPAAFEEEGFVEVVDVNLTGTMRCCRAFHDLLALRGGAIVNIASMMSFFGSATAPGYAASKGGVAQLTKSLALAWAEQRIRVNAVAPGWIATPLTARQIDDDLRQRVIARTPMRRWGEPQHIADAVEFLCSSRASFITGIVLPVDGGYTAN